MRTARSLPYRRVFVQEKGVSLDKDPLDRGPLEGTWDQAARQEVTSYRDPSPCGQTNTSENIK